MSTGQGTCLSCIPCHCTCTCLAVCPSCLVARSGLACTAMFDHVGKRCHKLIILNNDRRKKEHPLSYPTEREHSMRNPGYHSHNVVLALGCALTNWCCNLAAIGTHRPGAAGALVCNVCEVCVQWHPAPLRILEVRSNQERRRGQHDHHDNVRRAVPRACVACGHQEQGQAGLPTRHRPVSLPNKSSANARGEGVLPTHPLVAKQRD